MFHLFRRHFKNMCTKVVKHKLYDKFLKRKTYTNEQIYKNYKNLFETLKFKSKNNYYSKLISKNNLKNTWSVIKEVIGKTKIRSSTLPTRLVLNGIETYDKTAIGNGFNDYFRA